MGSGRSHGLSPNSGFSPYQPKGGGGEGGWQNQPPFDKAEFYKKEASLNNDQRRVRCAFVLVMDRLIGAVLTLAGTRVLTLWH